jgi:hypothetical protein
MKDGYWPLAFGRWPLGAGIDYGHGFARITRIRQSG